jgi:uncharacterized protein (DUF1778 family)
LLSFVVSVSCSFLDEGVKPGLAQRKTSEGGPYSRVRFCASAPHGCIVRQITVHFQGEDRMPVNLKQQRRPRKVARIEARLNPEQKRRIEYAARLKGTSLSDFMVLSADDAAARAIQEHEVWTLAGRDREVFVRTLLNPPAPSARMKAAAQRHEKRLGTL